MENSVLSDAAGVQKNIAKMYEEHAQKLGKTTDSLTQAEKAQAVYNGIMDEAGMFTGSAAEMAETYQGQQAKLNATTLELQRTLGESMIPTLTKITKTQNDVTKGIVEFTKNNKGATAGIVTLVSSLLGVSGATAVAITGITAFRKAAEAANMTTKAFTASILANPLFIGTLAFSIGISAINAYATAVQNDIDKMDEMTKKTEETTEALKEFQETGSLSESHRDAIDKAKNEADEIVRTYEEKAKKIEEIENKINEVKNSNQYKFYKDRELENLSDDLKEAKNDLEKFKDTYKNTGKTVDDYKNRLKTFNKVLEQSDVKQEYLTKTNISAQRQQLINIAQTKSDIDGKKKLLNILKQGKTTTEEYKDAKTKLVKVYPELAKVNDNTISSTEATIEAENKAADAEWTLAQATIMASIAELTTMKENKDKMAEIAQAMGTDIDNVTTSIETQINALTALSKLTPDDFKNSIDNSTYTPKTSSSKSSSSSQNKALENYKKQIEYKKSLDEISLQEEIEMYQYALKKYAKTQDEKMELNTKVYELQKELQEKTLSDYTDYIEYRKSMGQLSAEEEIQQYQYAYDNYAKTVEQRRELEVKLYELRSELVEQQMNDYTDYIEYRKSMDQLSAEEEIQEYEYVYNKYADTVEKKRELEVKLHELRKDLEEKRKEQLKAEADAEKEALDKKTENYKNYMETVSMLRYYDENEQIEDYNNVIQMHKEYLDKIMADERYSLDERKKLYEEELQIVKEYEQKKRDLRINSIDNTANQLTNAIKAQLEERQKAEENAINANIKLVEKWRDARVDAINSEYEARIDAIQKELDALDKADKQKTRDEEDSTYEKKRKRLEELIAFEHDATTKANYEKELEKLTNDYNSTLDKRALEDKKENLKEQQDILKDEQKAKVEAIKAEAEARINSYKTQLEEIKSYYNAQVAKAKETAQMLLINAKDNQEQILQLLSTYSDKYEVTGQTFGEKLAQGFSNVAEIRIAEVIAKIQREIDAAINSEISKYQTAKSSLSTYSTTVTNKTININQNNTITSPVDSPSVVYKKQETLNRNLASQIASVF